MGSMRRHQIGVGVGATPVSRLAAPGERRGSSVEYEDPCLACEALEERRLVPEVQQPVDLQRGA
jgi:hypothetical protein